MTLINLLNDEETFTDANNSQVLAVEPSDPDAIETALRNEDFSHVVTFEVDDQDVLIIHIHDASGVVVEVNDERGY